MKAICTTLSEYGIGRGFLDGDDVVRKTLGNTNDIFNNVILKGADAVTPDASTIAGLPGRATHAIANTTTGKYALGALAGLSAARYLAKKYENRNTRENPPNPTVSQPLEKKQKVKLAWEKEGMKMESTQFNIQEQNENLPRFPMLSYSQKIKPNSRSISHFFMKRKPNNYDTNAENDNIETSRKIAAKNVKDTIADTGVDKTIGKLVA
jgi:hypothetical protein